MPVGVSFCVDASAPSQAADTVAPRRRRHPAPSPGSSTPNTLPHLIYLTTPRPPDAINTLPVDHDELILLSETMMSYFKNAEFCHFNLV